MLDKMATMYKELYPQAHIVLASHPFKGEQTYLTRNRAEANKLKHELAQEFEEVITCEL